MRPASIGTSCNTRPHQGIQRWITDLNTAYRTNRELHEVDFDYTGFDWIDFQDSANSVIAFERKSARRCFGHLSSSIVHPFPAGIQDRRPRARRLPRNPEQRRRTLWGEQPRECRLCVCGAVSPSRSESLHCGDPSPSRCPSAPARITPEAAFPMNGFFLLRNHPPRRGC